MQDDTSPKLISCIHLTKNPQKAFEKERQTWKVIPFYLSQVDQSSLRLPTGVKGNVNHVTAPPVTNKTTKIHLTIPSISDKTTKTHFL